MSFFFFKNKQNKKKNPLLQVTHTEHGQVQVNRIMYNRVTILTNTIL